MFGIESKDFGILALFFVFYVGMSIIGLAIGIQNGEIKTKADMLKFVNPVETLASYNQWFFESWEQFKISDTMAQRNSIFGMGISLIGMLAFWLLWYSIWNIPFGNEWYAQLMVIFLSTTMFYLCGGFDAFETILHHSWDIFPERITIEALNVTTSTTTI